VLSKDTQQPHRPGAWAAPADWIGLLSALTRLAFETDRPRPDAPSATDPASRTALALIGNALGAMQVQLFLASNSQDLILTRSWTPGNPKQSATGRPIACNVWPGEDRFLSTQNPANG